ncbi:MAG: hypothetical protein FRX48_08146 [Lasallia pustulata]|uniref:BTB domain-containing protein n=1 Tax=Lasallia pustulata TaxID=136370 RepID=A0A5M8PEZ2_9LECA|nr:MAG: hypothetical protein FRX48_08146 [Lasallia pustulata]
MSDISQRLSIVPDISQGIYASTPFKFVVGGDPYYIHADLASSHSKPFDRMINGRMAEAQNGFAVLEDVDKGTFERFVEWAYKGYYTAGNYDLKASVPPSPVLSIKEEGNATEGMREATGWSEEVPPLEAPTEEVFFVERRPDSDSPFFGVRGTFKKDKKSKKAKTGQELKERFLCREYTVRRDAISIPPTRANRRENEDYTEVFLSHARLYVFAEKYDIQPLKTLALEELHSTLAIYTLYSGRTGDIIALLRYIYANTGVSTRGGDTLRTLLRDYVGCEMSILMKDGEFKDLMIEDGGPLLEDFMKMVAKRID